MDELMKKLIEDMIQSNPKLELVTRPIKISQHIKSTREDYENCSYQASAKFEKELLQFQVDMALDTGDKERFLALTGGQLS